MNPPPSEAVVTERVPGEHQVHSGAFLAQAQRPVDGDGQRDHLAQLPGNFWFFFYLNKFLLVFQIKK
jgi:hypothetical protein